MSKKHFIALADVMRQLRPTDDYSNPERFRGKVDQWERTIDNLADFCQAQNYNFNRDRWLSYIAGECGPNGGKVA